MKAIIILLTVASICTIGTADTHLCPPINEPGVNIHYPHPTDCQKYLTCNWGNLVEQLCPSGLLWNDIAKYCDYPQNVHCAVYPSTSTTVGTTWSSETDPTHDPPFGSPSTPFQTTSDGSATKCPEIYNPDHQVYLPHEDCDKYYICSWNGEALLRLCPAGLHWNQYVSYCDYPINVRCSASSVFPSTEDCPEIYDPNYQVYFPHPDCTKYYICTPERFKLEQNCPPNLHWSQEKRYCDHQELAQCTPGASNVNDVTSTEPPVKECPLFPTESDIPTFFPHANCAKYYVCDHGKPIEMSCPAGLFWNATDDVCDAPWASGCKQ